MKWVNIAKAKVKFGQLYLVNPEGEKDTSHPGVGYLEKSETTSTGIAHQFKLDAFDGLVTATHIAIITEPS